MQDSPETGLPARRAAARAYAETLQRGRPLDQTLASQPDFKRLDPRDRAFARLIAATALRRKGQIGAALSEFLERPLPDNAIHAMALLETAAAQMIFLETPPHAAVGATVTLMGERKETERYKSLANAVLRKVGQNADSLSHLAPVETNLPVWLMVGWTDAYGEEAMPGLAESWMGEPPLDLTLKDPAEAAQRATALDAECLPTGSLRLARAPRDLTRLEGFADGAWWVQDAAAAIPARLLGDLTGKRALDLCAAPGGKTMQLAAAGADITALDRSESRLKRVEENLARTGLSAALVKADAAKWTPPDGALFDAVLLDAPCTATGTLRRSPDVAWSKSPEDVAALARTQTAMIRHAAALVAPGGSLVYCTCSLQPDEGEAIVRAFLAEHPEFQTASADAAALGLPDEAVTLDGWVRTRPDFWAERGGMDGFFAARMNKSRSAGV